MESKQRSSRLKMLNSFIKVQETKIANLEKLLEEQKAEKKKLEDEFVLIYDTNPLTLNHEIE